MSITGSLVGFEGSNEINSNKRNARTLLNSSISSKHCSSLNTSLTNSVITSTSCSSNMKTSASTTQNHHQKSINNVNSHKKDNNHRPKIHFNTLWSVWYGILVTLFQGYLAIQGAHRYLSCSIIQWGKENQPTIELDIQIILCIFVIVLLPIFLTSALFKVGNLANDGVKLATGKEKSSSLSTDSLEKEGGGETFRNLWIHGGPTSAFIHIITSICLLCPRLFLEARLIETGILNKDQIWRTELDFMMAHRDRLVILSFMTSPYQNNTNPYDLYNLNGNNSDQESYNINRQNTFFEHTNLIERFRPELDDSEFENYENSHENMELKPTEEDDSLDVTTMNYYSFITESAKLLQTTVTPLTGVQTMSTSTLSTTKSTSSNLYKKLKTNPTKVDLLSTDQSFPDNSKELNLNKKHKQNKHNHHNHGGGQNQKSHNKNKNHRHRGNTEDTSPIAKVNKKHNRKTEISEEFDEDFIIDADDVDDNLELKPQRKINFDIFEDGSTKVVEFQKPPPPPPVQTNYKNNKKNKSKSQGSTMSSTSTTTTTTTSSNFTPVTGKPEKKSISASTAPNSKIIEIKPSVRGNSSTKRLKRYATDFYIEEDDSITRNIIETNQQFNKTMFELTKPLPLIGTTANGNISTLQPMKKLDGFSGFLQEFLGVRELDTSKWNVFPSLEYLNLALAILVWSVRYPSVFWGTSKSFSAVFSIQMIANGLDVLLGYAGISVLYKLQINNPQSLNFPALLLNALVTISLFIFATILIISSSMILYLYGHGRLMSKIRERDLISIKLGDSWIYFAHCASLCFVLALAVVKAPLLHDLSTVYRNSLDGAVLVAALGSVVHLFLWIVLWLGLTAKRRWSFKIPTIDTQATQPLINAVQNTGQPPISGSPMLSDENNIYWPKLTPNSPKLKVTFNEIPSTSSHHHDAMLGEHDGKRKFNGASLYAGLPGEPDDGDYATLRGPTGDLLHMSKLDREIGLTPVEVLQFIEPLNDDTTSEEGKLLESVRDDSVTYASTRDLEPPKQTHAISTETFIGSPEKILSPLAPVSVTVHASEIHISTISTPRCLRRADSGVPNEALTPRSDTTSTESSTSPPDRAPSESSSGVHSGEEREEVIIRPRPNVPYKPIIKQPPPAIQEEPFGRSTCMKMSSFNKENGSSATLPITRGAYDKPENHCNTMPLPVTNNQYRPVMQTYSPSSTKPPLHTTLPNGVRYTQTNQFLRRLPHMKNAESPYGHLGLGSGHHTFSKLLHEPLHSFNVTETIPEDRDSANYSNTSSENDNSINLQKDIYIHSGQLQIN